MRVDAIEPENIQDSANHRYIRQITRLWKFSNMGILIVIIGFYAS